MDNTQHIASTPWLWVCLTFSVAACVTLGKVNISRLFGGGGGCVKTRLENFAFCGSKMTFLSSLSINYCDSSTPFNLVKIKSPKAHPLMEFPHLY